MAAVRRKQAPTRTQPTTLAAPPADLASNLRQIRQWLTERLPELDVREREFRERCYRTGWDKPPERKRQERQAQALDRERHDALRSVFDLRREAYRQALMSGMQGRDIDSLFPRHGTVILPSVGDFLLLLDRLIIQAEVRASSGSRQRAAVPHTADPKAYDKIADEIVEAVQKLGRACSTLEIAVTSGHDVRTVTKRLRPMREAGRLLGGETPADWRLPSAPS